MFYINFILTTESNLMHMPKQHVHHISILLLSNYKGTM